ncbi:MAG: T9SS type A sorting domain-containing protein, partial [Gemmatimonadetes bacterium]|nr:T9SS type A sorting domain-containing protein [Gemmatimonadota bacterium]
FSGWSRMRLGWTAVEEVAGQRQEVRLTDVGIGGAVVKIPLDFGEYFLLEHRRTRTYYDRHVPGEGLLIWHVGNSWIDLECADGRWRDKGYPLGQQVDPARGEDNLDFWAHDRAYRSAHQGNLGDSTDVFDGIRFTAFTPQTNPASFRVDGHLSVRVEQIRWEQEQMWAEVDAPFIIQNLRLRSPADMEALIGFEGRALAIAGFLTVNGSSLLNLEGLNGLRVVDRDVWIDDNPALMSLEGLNELTRIGGDLVLSNNETLANLGALKQLRVVNRDVQINYNPELMSLEGLNRLTQVGGDLVFLNNETLISLEGLNRLTQVGDDLVLRDNETLTSLEGLNRLTQVGDDLVIIGNPRLTSLEGLRQLPQVEGNLIITGNSPHLTNSLIQNYPNPFNRGTMIRLDLLRSQDVDLALYNITGQRITSLINGYREAGTYILHWDGRDAQGQALASGVYLYRLRTRRQVETRKLLLLR